MVHNLASQQTPEKSSFFIKNFKSMVTLSSFRDHGLEVLKGFVMMLVVMGHLTTGDFIPYENLWYENLKQSLYSFHMPLFFILSGIIFQLQINNLKKKTRPHFDFKYQYFNFIIERSKRLLLPFLIMGVVITVAKFLFQPPAALGAPPLSLQSGLLKIIYETEQSPTRFIWFLCVLYILSVILFPVGVFVKNVKSPILFVTVILFFILFFLSPHLPDIIYLNRLGRHAIFFVVGLIISYNFVTITEFFKKILPLSIILFGILLSIAISYDSSNIMRHSLTGVISAMVFLPLCSLFTGNVALFLKVIGKYSFVIFLFNLPFIGITKMLIYKTIGFNGYIFNYTVFIIYLSGIICPILLKIFVLDKIPIINHYTN
jgi:fucose 4-O-acetylase-like acetyltransferase